MSLGVGSPVTIGRDSLLRLIDDVLEDACNRVSRSVLLTGEAGIGKTHMLRELHHRAKPMDLRIITARCSPNDEHDLFGLFMRLAAELGDTALQPPTTELQRYAVAKHLVETLRAVPTVVVIDDLQWCDYVSQRTLLHLFDLVSAAGIAVVVVSRPIDEVRSETGASNLRALARLMETHTVEGLSAEESAVLVSASLGHHVERPVLEMLMQLTNGNPFFLIEITRQRESINATDALLLPREVEAILDARLDLLGPEEDAVALAGIAGDVGRIDDLASVFEAAGITEDIWQPAVRAASLLRILTLTSTSYEFVHRLFTQRLDDRLSHSRRNSFHGAVATMLAARGDNTQAIPHVVRSGRSLETNAAASIMRLALRECVRTGNHVGTIESAEWLLAHTPSDGDEAAPVMVSLATALIGVGRRDEGYRHAETAAHIARAAGDHETEASALMQWSSRKDFAPQRGAMVEAFKNLDLAALSDDTRARVLATWAQASALVPTPESVAESASSALLAALDSSGMDHDSPPTAGTSAWNWISHAEQARELADRAEMEVSSTAVSSEARLQVLLAWRETHRSPQFLAERLERTSEAVRISKPGPHSAGAARFCHVLDLLESGDHDRADAEIAALRTDAMKGGVSIARWWSEFLTAGRHISRGELDIAAVAARRAFDHGERADEPGRTMIMLEQMAIIALERGIPAEMRGIFSTSTGVVSNDYAGAVAALVNASFRNDAMVRDLLAQSAGALSDTDREAAWLPTVAAITEAAHLVGDVGTAARCLPLLEPFESHQVTFIGSTVRGSVRRYVALARAAAGDVTRAVDDLLVTRNEERVSGQHLWALACSVDILEILARSDPARALRLVGADEFDESSPLGDTWRAHRGRHAMSRARTDIAREVGLSERQATIVVLLLTGATIKAIGEELGYSHSTIRQETIEIYRILGIGGRSDLRPRAAELMIG